MLHADRLIRLRRLSTPAKEGQKVAKTDLAAAAILIILQDLTVEIV
jgi:hypothetical protein